MGVGDNRNLVGDADPLIWTPSAVKAELGRIRGVLDTINLEMTAAVRDGKMSGDDWKSWFDGTYTPGHKLTDESSSLWGSNVVAAREQEQSALKWRDLVKSRGGKTVGPSNLGRTPDLIPANMKLAGIAVGGIVLYMLLKDKL